MEELEVTPMEEDEVVGAVRHTFECELGLCGGRENLNHVHTPECRASTSGRDRLEGGSSGNYDGKPSLYNHHIISWLFEHHFDFSLRQSYRPPHFCVCTKWSSCDTSKRKDGMLPT